MAILHAKYFCTFHAKIFVKEFYFAFFTRVKKLQLNIYVSLFYYLFQFRIKISVVILFFTTVV